MWTVIVPVKQTSLAKSRLASIEPTVRQRLATAFALDTVSAALACDLVAHVIVVTDDPLRSRFVELGAIVLPDEPDAGINPALNYAADYARERFADTGVAAISADLPALRPEDLARALGVEGLRRWFVSDAAGLGTTLIAAMAREAWTPMFGDNSRRAHAGAGMSELQIDGLDRLHQDVDTEADVEAAQALGVGPHTQRTLDTLR